VPHEPVPEYETLKSDATLAAFWLKFPLTLNVQFVVEPPDVTAPGIVPLNELLPPTSVHVNGPNKTLALVKAIPTEPFTAVPLCVSVGHVAFKHVVEDPCSESVADWIVY